MKILQVMPDFEMAGAQTMLENLVMELKKNKENEIRIISFFNKKCAITDRLEKNNIRIYYLNKKRGFDISIVFKLRKIFNEYLPDVVHTHRYALEYVVPAYKLSKSHPNIIHTVHNIAEKEVPRSLQLFQKRWFKKHLAIPVAISEKIKASILSRYNLNETEVPMIYNGIDLTKCKVKDNYENNNIILHIGRFSEQKNHLRTYWNL